MTNSVDTDQMASSEAILSGSTLFAKVGVVVNSKIRVNSWKTLMSERMVKSLNLYWPHFTDL